MCKMGSVRSGMVCNADCIRALLSETWKLCVCMCVYVGRHMRAGGNVCAHTMLHCVLGCAGGGVYGHYCLLLQIVLGSQLGCR